MSCDALLDVVGLLTDAEFDHAHFGQAARAERIFARDRLDLLAARADGEDDAAVSRNLAARNDKVAGRVVFLTNFMCAAMCASISASGAV